MPAYLVFTRLRTKDQSALDAYFDSGDLFDALPFKPLVTYGHQEVLEGDEHEGMVILEFDSAETAKNWYDSPAYRQAREHRFRGADYQVTVVVGNSA